MFSFRITSMPELFNLAEVDSAPTATAPAPPKIKPCDDTPTNALPEGGVKITRTEKGEFGLECSSKASPELMDGVMRAIMNKTKNFDGGAKEMKQAVEAEEKSKDAAEKKKEADEERKENEEKKKKEEDATKEEVKKAKEEGEKKLEEKEQKVKDAEA